MFDFDSAISEWCAEFGIVYTRYADDITFSTTRKNILFSVPKIVKNMLAEHASGITINEAKTIFTSKAHNRHVTGVTITTDGKLSIGRKRKKYLHSLVFKYSKGELTNDEVLYAKGLMSYCIHIERNIIIKMKKNMVRKLSIDFLRRVVMNDSKKRVDNVFSEFIGLINDGVPEDKLRHSPVLGLLNESLNKDNLYLKKISIVDYKRLRDVIVNLEDDLTVFVADNGYGKTTLLDAIAISLSWLRSNIQKKDKPGTYIREVDINNSKEALYASIAATFKVQELNTNILITSAKDGVSFKRSNDLQEIKLLATMYRYVNTFLENSSLPVMAYYSIVRSVVGGGVDNRRRSGKNKVSWSKFDVYDDFMFDRNDFGEFLNWLMFLSNKSVHENPIATDNPESLRKEIESINNTIEQLSIVSNIDFNIINHLKNSLEEKRFQLKKLSSESFLSSSESPRV